MHMHQTEKYSDIEKEVYEIDDKLTLSYQVLLPLRVV